MLSRKFLEPFKKIIKSNSKWLTFIKDFNFNYKPSQVTFKADVFRQFGATRPKNVGGGPYKIPETYDKYFTFDRYYIVRWDLTRSINLDYSATNNARIDEPFGRIDTRDEKDSVRKNLFKGGRNTRFHQEATFTYNFPTNKFPLLDWTTLRASYKAEYDWIGASLLARTQGNVITNGQTKSVNGEFNFDQLYTKWKFLKAVYSSSPSSGNKENPANNKKNSETNKENPAIKDSSNAKNKKIVLSDSLTKKQSRLLSKLERKRLKKEKREI